MSIDINKAAKCSLTGCLADYALVPEEFMYVALELLECYLFDNPSVKRASDVSLMELLTTDPDGPRIVAYGVEHSFIGLSAANYVKLIYHDKDYSDESH